MKCSRCGFENSNQSNFCTNCGDQLHADLFCRHCGNELPPKSKYCLYCGTKVGSMIPSARSNFQASKKKKTVPKPYKRSGTPSRAARTKLVGYSSLALIIIVIGGILLLTLPRRAQTVSKGNETSIVWAADVQRIASNFNCPCGQCGIARLDTCTCDIVGGANEAKSYIQYLLNQGLPDNEVITKVEERYGNRVL